MLSKLKEHAGMAGLLVAVMALVVGVTGIAGALPGKKSVDKNDLTKNAVASKNVAPDTLNGSDIKESTLDIPAAAVAKDTFGARVDAAGVLTNSTVNGVSSKKDGTGTYSVTFPRDVSKCVLTVSGSSAAPVSSRAFVSNTPTVVFVGLSADSSFGLIATC